MKRLSILISLSLLLLSGTAQASYRTSCRLMVQVLKQTGPVKRVNAHSVKVPLELYVLQVLRDSTRSTHFCRRQLLVGTAQSVTLNGHPKKLPAFKNGLIGSITYRYSSHPRYGSSIRWSDFTPIRARPKQLAKWFHVGTPYGQIKASLVKIEKNAAQGKPYIYYPPKMNLFKRTWTSFYRKKPGRTPASVLFSTIKNHPKEQFYVQILLRGPITVNMDLKAIRKGFSYFSVTTSPLDRLLVPGWHINNNRTWEVLRRNQLGKRVKIIAYNKGILYLEATFTLRNVTLHHIKPPCAPLQLSKPLKPTCKLQSKVAIPVKFKYAFPLAKVVRHCLKNPRHKRCR